jgi:membrane protein DedA with SNARE-associated domain
MVLGGLMMELSIMTGLLAHSAAVVQTLITHYGYLAIFILMVLESASLPIPSEVLLPLSGYLSYTGTFNFCIAFGVLMLGSIIGMAIAYGIGYYLGKDVIYKHLRLFHIKEKSLKDFDAWFERNGIAAVFLSRFIPEIRALMSFPAGFAKMPLKEFFAYSIAGAFIWNLVLMLFGFYLLSAHSAVIIMASIGIFAVALYVIYKIAIRHIKR